ncbi:MAG TPA: potassium channel family protein [Acidimicrobiia bacterium]|nr:potassium channel family protein [Acidimicrobiia bacterium]
MLRGLWRTFREVWVEPAGRGLILLAAVIVAIGTVFYMVVEGWSVVDALYFTVVTLTTIGYGDLHPTTDLSKLFTIFFVFAGVSFILGFLNFIVARTVRDRVERKRGSN